MHNCNALAPIVGLIKELASMFRRFLLGENPHDRPPPACCNLPSGLLQKPQNSLAFKRQKTSVVAFEFKYHTGRFLAVVKTDRFAVLWVWQVINEAAWCGPIRRRID